MSELICDIITHVHVECWSVGSVVELGSIIFIYVKTLITLYLTCPNQNFPMLEIQVSFDYPKESRLNICNNKKCSQPSRPLRLNNTPGDVYLSFTWHCIIIIIDNFCITLFSIRYELIALLHIHTASDDDDDDDDDDVHSQSESELLLHCKHMYCRHIWW